MGMDSVMEFAKFAVGAMPIAVKTVEDAYNFICRVMKDRMSEKTKECMETLVQQAEASGVTEVTASDIPVDVLAELKAEADSLIKESQDFVYTSCVELFFDIPLNYDQLERLRNAFTDNEGVWDSEEDNELQNEIEAFFIEYAAHPASEGDDFVLTKDSLAVNYEVNRVYIREHVSQFADVLNRFLGDTYITHFSVFWI